MTMQYGGFGARRVGVEVALLEPEVVPAVLGVLGVVLLGEVGEAHAFDPEDREPLGMRFVVGISFVIS